MDIEDIKIGETYNVRVQVVKKETARVCCHTISKDGNCFSDFLSWFSKAETAAFSPMTPETAPKYDPCRKFRKGDKVRAVEYKGRRGTDCPNFTGKIYTVSQEERSNGLLKLTDDVYIYYIDPAYVELVTPVEELEPYRVKQNMQGRSYEVKSPTPVRTVAAFFYGGENPAYTEEKALAAAEAECARLNVAHRKEQA